MELIFENWRKYLNEEKELKVQKNPSGFTLDIHVNGEHVGQYTHSREGDEVRNTAEIFPEFRKKGYGTMMLLAAIKTAGDLGMGFEEDSQSLTKEMSRLYDELAGSGLILGGEGSWAITPSGEDELDDWLSDKEQYETPI